MKFTLRDLFWFILLAAVICLAYRHERLFKRSTELEAIRKFEQVRQEMVQKHRTDLDRQEMRNFQVACSPKVVPAVKRVITHLGGCEEDSGCRRNESGIVPKKW